MPLTASQTRFLRARAHHLKPVVMIGEKGVTDNIHAEVDQALTTHELIKVSIAGADRAGRQETGAALCAAGGADLVQIIGRIAVLYRPAPKPRLVLPK